MPLLKYHQATFDMLGRTPVLSQLNQAALDRREKALGLIFPPSVREWYSLKDCVKFLRYYSNADRPLRIKELGSKRGGVENLAENPANYYHPLYPFLSENQVAFELAFYANGSADPPVFVWDDDGLWREGFPSFSYFVHTWIWDNLYNRYHTVFTSSSALSSETLNLLRADFTELYPEPGPPVYRFEGKNQHLKIYSNPDTSDWWLETKSVPTMRKLVQTVGKYEPFAAARFKSFYVRGFNPAISQLLTDLQNEA